MNICYKMFSSMNNVERSALFENAKTVFNSINELNTPTVLISNQEELKRFIQDNPRFKFDIMGYNLDNKQGWKFGELGIWASNWSAWNNFLNSEYDYLILMEDDLICNQDLYETILLYINECPKDFHALYIFIPQDQFNKYDYGLDVSENLSISYQDWSSACYVVQKNTIKDLIEDANSGFNLPLDWFTMRQKHKFNIYSVKPTSYSACSVKAIESTFQTIQERQIINGIF